MINDLPQDDLIAFFLRYERRRGRLLKVSEAVQAYINERIDRLASEMLVPGATSEKRGDSRPTSESI